MTTITESNTSCLYLALFLLSFLSKVLPETEWLHGSLLAQGNFRSTLDRVPNPLSRDAWYT